MTLGLTSDEMGHAISMAQVGALSTRRFLPWQAAGCRQAVPTS